jgi:prophage antirepressor-like protein
MRSNTSPGCEVAVRQEPAVHAFPQTGQTIRTVTVNGEPWFVAADVCRILEIGRTHDAVRGLDGDEKGTDTIRTPGGEQQVSIVSEAGLWSLMLRSRKPEARAFRRWITHEVIPAIRRTGTYAAPAISKRELARMIIAEADRADAAEARAAELVPAAEAWGVLAEATGDYSLREAAHILNRDPAISTGQNRLMRFLRDEGLVDRRGIPYARHSRHLVERPIAYSHPHTGEPVLKSQIRITVDGLEYLRKRLGGIGQEVAGDAIV